MKTIQVEIWDRTNGVSTGKFSNAPLGCNIDIDLEGATMTIKNKTGLANTVLDIAPGDVFEIRVRRQP